MTGGSKRQAEQVKRAVDADKTLAKPDKQRLKTEVEGVVKQAKTLQSLLEDGKPSTADASALRGKGAARTAAGRQLPPAVPTAVAGLHAPQAKLDQAFGIAAAPGM